MTSARWIGYVRQMPHEGQTFTNTRSGQQMTFVELRGELLRIETVNPPEAPREPLHVHPKQVSGATVNGGDTDAHATQEFRPALDIASFFETYAALAAEGKLKSDGMPPALQLALMIPAFADEIRVPAPPWPVQRAFAALLGPLARARGYRARLSAPGNA